MPLFSLIRQRTASVLLAASLVLVSACADTPAGPSLPLEANASNVLQLNLSTTSAVLAQAGSSAPLPEPFVIIASNAAALIPSTGIQVSAPAYAHGQPGGWLEVKPKILGLTASITLSVKPNGLPDGAYQATFTVKVPGTKNSPQTVSVTYAKGFYLVDGAEGATWTVTGLWHRSKLTGICNTSVSPTACLPAPAEGQWALWYGQDNSGDYETGVFNEGTATSPLFAIPVGAPHPELRFQASWEVESDSPQSFDQMEVWLVSEDGSTSHRLGTINHSPSFTENHIGGYMSVGADLAAYAGGVWRIQFRFDTGDTAFNDYRGWIVDDVRIGEAGAFTNPGIWLSPNANQPVMRELPSRRGR